MTTIDHGNWLAYTPAPPPEGAPANAMFARRESDGVDWYDYVNPGTNFQPGTVVIAAYLAPQTGQYIVGPATYTHTAIFPAGCIVHEVTDYAGSDPQADLGSKAFDPATGAFTDPIIPSQTGALQDLVARLAALEAKQRGA
jgi:hypothetical protein